mgnify:CR=1 FL=1
MKRAEAPKLLEYNWGGGDLRWELEPLGGGTRLTLWHNIDRRFISWGAAGWHICFDVLERFLAGEPIGRMVGTEVMKFGGWQRLNGRVREAVWYRNTDGSPNPRSVEARPKARRSPMSTAVAPTRLRSPLDALDRPAPFLSGGRAAAEQRLVQGDSPHLRGGRDCYGLWLSRIGHRPALSLRSAPWWCST